jgi:hypothetical protein
MEANKEKRKEKDLRPVKSDTKKLSAAGKWLNDTHASPFMKIIDMKAVLR